MGKPYSMDLRERAVVAVLQGGLSGHESAARFGVAPSTVINWVRRFRETGGLAAGRMGGRKPKAIAGEHAIFLTRRVRDGAFTLRGLVGNWLSAALRSIIDRCGISFTPRSSASKKPSSPANAIGLTWRGGAPSGRSARAGLTPSVWRSSTRRGRRPTWSRCAALARKGERLAAKVPHGHWQTITFVALFVTTALRRRG
jgi:transposase